MSESKTIKVIHFFNDNKEKIIFGLMITGASIFALKEFIDLAEKCYYLGNVCYTCCGEIKEKIDEIRGIMKCSYCGKCYKKHKSLRKHEVLHEEKAYVESLDLF